MKFGRNLAIIFKKVIANACIIKRSKKYEKKSTKKEAFNAFVHK